MNGIGFITIGVRPMAWSALMGDTRRTDGCSDDDLDDARDGVNCFIRSDADLAFRKAGMGQSSAWSILLYSRFAERL